MGAKNRLSMSFDIGGGEGGVESWDRHNKLQSGACCYGFSYISSKQTQKASTVVASSGPNLV